ncbi:MAG: hypothetical protein AAFP17_13825 [Pseudomonadota bacterium]
MVEGAEGAGALCTIHIGAEKTGTTSIQESLHANRARLAAAGIAWPEFLGHRNHKLLAAAALPADSEDAAMAGNAFAGVPAAHAAHRSEVAERLATLAAHHREVILSSEDLQRLPRAAVETLGALLRPAFARFRVVVFLLRQDILALRRRAQLIRTGHMADAAFPALNDPSERRFYDYAALLSDWAAVFGEDAIMPVPMGDGSAAAGADSVTLFYDTLGIDSTGFSRVPRLNASPDTPSLQILNRANGAGLLPGSPRRTMLEERLGAFEADRRPPVPRAAAAAFLDRFAASNAAVAARWLSGEPPFGPALATYPVDDPGTEIVREAERRLLLLAAGEGAASAPAATGRETA